MLALLLNLGFAGGGGVVTPTAFDDLTTVFVPYLKALAAAHSGGDDAATQLAADLHTVRGSSTNLDDANTMYAEYLTPLY